MSNDNILNLSDVLIDSDSPLDLSVKLEEALAAPAGELPPEIAPQTAKAAGMTFDMPDLGYSEADTLINLLGGSDVGGDTI